MVDVWILSGHMYAYVKCLIMYQHVTNYVSKFNRSHTVLHIKRVYTNCQGILICTQKSVSGPITLPKKI